MQELVDKRYVTISSYLSEKNNVLVCCTGLAHNATMPVCAHVCDTGKHATNLGPEVPVGI